MRAKNVGFERDEDNMRKVLGVQKYQFEDTFEAATYLAQNLEEVTGSKKVIEFEPGQMDMKQYHKIENWFRGIEIEDRSSYGESENFDRQMMHFWDIFVNRGNDLDPKFWPSTD